MNRQTIKDAVELVGIAAIVVSLIFLTIEIRQNTRAIDAAEMNNIWSGWREAVILPVLENLQLADVLDRNTRGESLTAAESVQMFLYRVGQFDIWAQLFDLHKDGLITDEKWGYWESGFWNMLEISKMEDVWPAISTNYDPAFGAYVTEGFEKRAKPERKTQ